MRVGKISVSQLNNFDSCNRKWLLGKLLSFKGSPSFHFGLAYHNGIQEYGESDSVESAIGVALDYLFKERVGGKLYKEVLEEKSLLDLRKKGFSYKLKDMADFEIEGLKEKIEKQIEKDKVLLPQMVRRYVNFLTKNKFTICKSEMGFVVPLLKGLDVDFRVDRILEKEGRYFLSEDKTGRDTSIRHLDMDLQTTAYLALSEKVDFGVPIQPSLIYTKCSKNLEEEPRILKGGKLSTAKDQSCTAERYYQVACEMGLENDDKVLECFEHLSQRNKFFVSTLVEKTDEEKKNCLAQLKLRGKDLIRAQKFVNKNESDVIKCLKNTPCRPSMDCFGFCSYYYECMNINKGVL